MVAPLSAEPPSGGLARRGTTRTARQAEDLDAYGLAEVLAQDPRTLGYRATGWTVPLLTTHLNQKCGGRVSQRTLRRRLEQYGWRWKRLRYFYQERAPHIG